MRPTTALQKRRAQNGNNMVYAIYIIDIMDFTAYLADAAILISLKTGWCIFFSNNCNNKRSALLWIIF